MPGIVRRDSLLTSSGESVLVIATFTITWSLIPFIFSFAGSRLFALLRPYAHHERLCWWCHQHTTIIWYWLQDKGLKYKIIYFRDILVWIFTHVHLWFKQASYNRFLSLNSTNLSKWSHSPSVSWLFQILSVSIPEIVKWAFIKK